ncbi:MAG: trimethylamine methyltransferase family protein [Chloroflexi bacterium]|nr:trimethylamine methyltransferase family protein [Chloroflexota bacterium]
MLLKRIPKMNIFDDQQLQVLMEDTYRILEEVGCAFALDAALDLLEALPGTEVDRDSQRVRFERATIQRALRQCPSTFALHGRHPSRTVTVGGDNVTFTTVIGAPFVQDFKRGRRKGSLADFAELVKIAQMLPEIDVVDSGICEPQDLEVDARSLWRVYTCFKECDRPLAGSTWGQLGVEDSLAIADIVFNTRVDWPVFCSLMSGVAPLGWDDRICEAIIGYARRGQALVIGSLPMGGFTGPITQAGSLTVGYAAQLAGIALAQAARPGTPVVFSCGGSPADMKTGNGSPAGPERALAALAGAQLSRALNLPSRIYAGSTSSKAPDLQAGWEKMLGMLTAIFAGGHYFPLAAGSLDSALVASYELLVADADILGMVRRMLRGIEITPETLAFDVIKEVGPFGEFITHEHTFKHFRGASWEGRVVDRNFYAEWVRRGSKTAEERAYDVWNELLATHEVEPLDPAAEREIKQLIAAREREIERAAAAAG